MLTWLLTWAWVASAAPGVGGVDVFHDGPLVADGDTDSLVQVYLPGITARDDLKVAARGAAVVDFETGPQGTLFVTLRPRAVSKPGSIKLSVEGQGVTRVSERFDLPVAPPVRPIGADRSAPEGQTFAFVPWPADTGLPVGERVSLWLFVADADGLPLDRIPTLEITSPSQVDVRHSGGGWHEVQLQVPETLGPFEVRAVLGDRTSTLSFRAVPGVPEIVLDATPSQLGDGVTVTRVVARLPSPAGHTLEDLRLLAPTLEGEVVFAGVDVRTAELDVTGQTRVPVSVGVSFEGTGLPPARLRLWPGQTWAGEQEPIPVFVLVEDALGLPVPDQQVRLWSSERLEGLPVVVDTGEHGWGVVSVQRKPQDVVEPLVIEAATHSLQGATVLWPHVGALGTTDDALARARWAHALPTLVLRENAPPRGTAVEDPPHGPARRADAIAEALPPQQPTPRRPDPRDGPGLEWRARVALFDAGYGARQEALDGTYQPQTANWDDRLLGGAFGFGGSGELWLDGRFIFDLDARVTWFATDLDGTRQQGTLGQWRAGARMQGPILGPFSWQVGAWLHRGNVPFAALDNAGNSQQLGGFALTGVRLGGGVALDFEPVDVRLEVAETFTLAPTWTTARLQADVPLGIALEDLPLHLTGGVDFDYRRPKHQASVGASNGTFRVRDTQFVLFVGVGIGSF